MFAATIFFRCARMSCRINWMSASFTCSRVTVLSLAAGVGVGCCATSDVATASTYARHDAKEIFFIADLDNVSGMFCPTDGTLCQRVDELEEQASASVARSEHTGVRCLTRR